MILANEIQIARFCGEVAYPNGAMIDSEAAAMNKEIALVTGGKMPVYVSRIGSRGAPVYVSVGSSARIGKSEALRMIARFKA